MLAAYALLVLGVFDNDGQYSSVGLTLTLAGFLVFVLAMWRVAKPPVLAALPSQRAIAAILLLLLVFGVRKAPCLWLHDLTFVDTTRTACWSVAGGTALAYLLLPTSARSRASRLVSASPSRLACD